LKRELDKGRKERPKKRIQTKEEKEKEREMVERFLGKGGVEVVPEVVPGAMSERDQVENFVNKQKKMKSELSRLMSDPTIVQQEPENPVCANDVHDDPEPASFKLVHGGLFGDLPPIYLCEHCIKLIKIVPMREKDLPQVHNKREPLRWTHQKKNSLNIEDRLKSIAGRLDRKGLYIEADVVDKILMTTKK